MNMSDNFYILFLIFTLAFFHETNCQNLKYKDGEPIGNDAEILLECRNNLIANGDMIGTNAEFDKACLCIYKDLWSRITFKELEIANKNGTVVELFGSGQNLKLFQNCIMKSGLTVNEEYKLNNNAASNQMRQNEINLCIDQVKLKQDSSDNNKIDPIEYCTCFINKLYKSGITLKEKNSSNSLLMQEIAKECILLQK